MDARAASATAPEGAGALRPAALAARLELLAWAVFGRRFSLCAAAPPAPRFWRWQLFAPAQAPPRRAALPATDGERIWLPAGAADFLQGDYRTMLLRQAMRAVRGSAAQCPFDGPALLRALYLVLEARAADAQLARLLPGTAAALSALRADALLRRPPLAAFPAPLQPLERWVRAMLGAGPGLPAGPAEVLAQAARLQRDFPPMPQGQGARLLHLDGWSGELRAPPPHAAAEGTDAGGRGGKPAGIASVLHAAHPSRARARAWRVARAAAAGAATGPARPAADDACERRHYPEWDWRSRSYRTPGATVLLLPAADGPQEWVERTLAERGAMLDRLRRRFELLRARRALLRRQLDGEQPDLQAWLDSQADWRAGLPMAQRLYQRERRARREMAVSLLVDASASTGAAIARGRRVIDVEREALLLVCVALSGLGERFAVQAFSGEGPHGVVVRTLKPFGQRYGDAVARRIAGLEPEKYTRAGAAIRHASAQLMAEPAAHRLLLLLSDGKPNDCDQYDGQYGVEDMRQAVAEARLHGIAPFCLAIERAQAGSLPLVFGTRHYALLPRPELLPAALPDWLGRLLGR